MHIFALFLKEERVEEEEDDQTDDGAMVSPEALIKHPLQNRWALWFFKNDRTKEWTANLKLITAFDTVEDFWGLVIFCSCYISSLDSFGLTASYMIVYMHPIKTFISLELACWSTA